MLHSPLLFQFQSYWYYTVQYSSTNPYDTTVPYCPSTSTADTISFISAPALDLLIRDSPQLPQYQSYWYPTFHCCPSNNPILPSITPLPQYQIYLYLPQYQSYWYCTIHNCPSTNPTDTLQSTIAPVPVLFIEHFYPRTGPTYSLQYTIAPMPVLWT